ncbi:efflux RND transporter periplasmic adaptor subunit [bacterium]|nr:efflux RND transporter periplasmic adaptor subunit [bacterium]
MRRFSLAFILLGSFLSLVAPCACGQDDGHDHGPAADTHDEAPPTVAVTQWTDTMELFMEYPEMVAMQSGRFIIHLTVLEGFQPVRDGRVTLEFTDAGGRREVRTADTLLREGIFAPDVGLKDAGAYDFTLKYEGPGASSTFHIPHFEVHAAAAGIHAHAGGPEGDIAFLKEQQWKIPFATAPAVRREMLRAVWAIGQVLPDPRASIEITAPIAGIVQAAGPDDLILPGARVGRGDVVARISPPLQGDGWTGSRLALAQAERNYRRAERLRESDAISSREFEEAENDYLARKAGHDNLAGGGNDRTLALTAPIDGQVMAWDVRPGQRLEAGDRLMTIVDPGVVWLQVNVYESDFRSLGTPVGAWINDDDGGWEVPRSALTVLTTGGALDPVTRTVPVLLEIENSAGLLTINESTPVELYAGDGVVTTAVPRSAVYEDEGLDVVFVQTGGESFAKRIVRVGPHHAGWVSILEGVAEGERVVIRGGYHVKLAATTAEIGHGHAH